MATFILVHGAWHGGWCWDKISERLRAAGHQAIALDLPGHGDDPRPLEKMTIKAYATRVGEVLDALSEPAILVGHSMGGMVISQVAEALADKVQALVYVCALLMKDGETMQDPQNADPESHLAGNITFLQEGLEVMVKPQAIPDLFYHDCPPEDVARAKSLLCRQSASPFAAAITTSEANFGRVPRYYVECLQDRAITPAAQQRMYTNLPCKEVFKLDCSHSPFFAMPDELTAILEQIADAG